MTIDPTPKSMNSSQTNGSNSVATNSKSPPFKVSLSQAFFALTLVIKTETSYYYVNQDKSKIPISSKGFTGETMKGLLFFINHFFSETSYASPKSFLEFKEAVNTLSEKELDTSSKKLLSTHCQRMAKSNLTASWELVSTAIRKTLREIHSNLYQTKQTLPPNVQGQLFAIFIFIKETRIKETKLPKNILEDVDKLLTMALDLQEPDQKGTNAASKTTDPIYYFIQNTFILHFQKDSSWTASYNASFLSSIFGNQV